MSIPEVQSKNRLLAFLQKSLRLVDSIRAKILYADILRTNKIDTQTGDLHIYGDNTPNNYGIQFDESTGHVSVNKANPSATYEFNVGGHIYADDTLYANDNVYAVASDFFGYGAHIGTFNIDLGSGQRAEFGWLGGQTYSAYNGALWAQSQASNLNAETVLQGQASDNGRLYDVLGPAAWSSDIYFYTTTATGAGGTATTRRAEISTIANPFTGQHPCEPLDEALTLHREDYVGLIVRSVGDYKRWDKVSQAWETGKESITINEALPRVELSSTPRDKAAFGVISNMPNVYVIDTETGEYEKDEDGVAIRWGNIQENQLRINSLGEGAIWVCNISGNLENGDYITTCEIPGLGMKQDDDLLHNYTVAKITQDCDFRINAANYNVVEFEFSGSTYRKAFVGCTYHCG